MKLLNDTYLVKITNTILLFLKLEHVCIIYYIHNYVLCIFHVLSNFMFMTNLNELLLSNLWIRKQRSKRL